MKAIVRKLIGYQTEQANLLMFAVGGRASVHDQLGERVSLVANLRESLISRVCGYDSDLYCLFSTHIENVTEKDKHTSQRRAQGVISVARRTRNDIVVFSGWRIVDADLRGAHLVCRAEIARAGRLVAV